MGIDKKMKYEDIHEERSYITHPIENKKEVIEELNVTASYRNDSLKLRIKSKDIDDEEFHTMSYENENIEVTTMKPSSKDVYETDTSSPYKDDNNEISTDTLKPELANVDISYTTISYKENEDKIKEESEENILHADENINSTASKNENKQTEDKVTLDINETRNKSMLDKDVNTSLFDYKDNEDEVDIFDPISTGEEEDPLISSGSIVYPVYAVPPKTNEVKVDTEEAKAKFVNVIHTDKLSLNNDKKVTVIDSNDLNFSEHDKYTTYSGNLIHNIATKDSDTVKHNSPSLNTVISLPGYYNIRQPLVLQYPGMVTATITRVVKSYSWD